MSIEAQLTIIAGFTVGLLLIFLQGIRTSYRLTKDNEALEARLTEMKEKSEREGQDRDAHLKKIYEHYDSHIEEQDRKLKDLVEQLGRAGFLLKLGDIVHGKSESVE